jgi:hypothetical protein
MEALAMSDPIPAAAPGDAAHDAPVPDHPQAQAAQWPGGGGAPETGSDDETPTDKAAAVEIA